MARRVVYEREDRVIRELCDHLALREGVEVVVTSRPDREPDANGGCDALVQRGSVACAVEVTRLFQAPQHPRVVKLLEEIRPAIAKSVVAAFPASIVMVGVPVEEFQRGLDWQALCRSVSDAAIEALRDLSPGVRLPVTVPGLQTRAFVEVIREDVPAGFCAVNPVVWGRDPEDLTVLPQLRMLPARQLRCIDLTGADRRAAMFGRASAGIHATPCADAKTSSRAAAHRHSLTLR